MKYKPETPLGILLFDTTSPLGYRTVLEKSRFEDHIATDGGHIEMKDNVMSIKETIEDPSYILQSSKNPKRHIYIGKSSTSTYPNLHIKTIVDHEPEFSYIVTSMFQRRVNILKEGDVIYEKTTD